MSETDKDARRLHDSREAFARSLIEPPSELAETKGSGDEREILRSLQAKHVMPLIGGLLANWDQLSNDMKIDPELELVRKQIQLIDEAMENPQNNEGQP